MADIFDEINEDLRAERARALLKRYGIVLAALLVLVLAGIGGWQFWRSRQLAQSAEVAGRFLEAMRKATPAVAGLELGDAFRAEALAGFGEIAGAGAGGYRTLARVRAASLQLTGGEREAGLAGLDKVSADTAADPLLRGLADLLWVQAQLDAGEPSALEGRLASLLTSGNAWQSLAQEQQALLFLRTGRADGARTVLRQLVANGSAPGNARTRAAWLLARMGDGVPGAGG